MAVAEHSEFLEVDNVIYEATEITTRAQEKDQQKIQLSDIRPYKWFGVGVGLLCAVLALLNIAVPLYLYQSNMVAKEQLVNSYNQLLDSNNNLTEERDQLHVRNNNLTKERVQLQDSNSNLTKERDNLKRRLCESPGWQKLDRGCYYISTEEKTWEESRQWCRDRQSDLIVIKSKEKQDFVNSFNKRVWLGLTDREREGSFNWLDGTSLTRPMYWIPGAPNNKDLRTNEEQDCVEYYDGSLPGFPYRGWNDLTCSNSINNWICERDLC